MSTNSKIEWCEDTWNPTTGCSKVSEGCRHCYAEKLSARFVAKSGKYMGVTANGKFNGTLRLHEDVLEIPLRRRKPTMYFVNAMSDLFHEKVPFEFIDKVFAVMALCPRHTFQILTKRSRRMADYAADPGCLTRVAQIVAETDGAASMGVTWPLRHVWLGTSVEDQASADERIPHVLRCPAAVRFLSVEPLLDHIDLKELDNCPMHYAGICPEGLRVAKDYEYHGKYGGPWPIDWVIVGGESGPGARPCNVEWVRSIIAQCKGAEVPCFVKQLGRRPVWTPLPGGAHMDVPGIAHPKGGDPSEWPEDLRVREWPA